MSGIVRVRKSKETGNYSVIHNVGLQSRTLTYGARGLLGYLMTKPDDWEVMMGDLVAGSPDGLRVVRRIFRELQGAGYVERYRMQDDKGQFRWITTVHESPQPSARYASMDKPPMEKPSMENVSIYKELNKQSTELLSTEREKSARTENPQPEPENQRRPFDIGSDDSRYHTEHFFALCEICEIDPDTLEYAPQQRARVAAYAVGLSEKYTVEEMKLARSRWPFATAPSPKQFILDIKKYLNAKEATNEPVQQSARSQRRSQNRNEILSELAEHSPRYTDPSSMDSSRYEVRGRLPAVRFS